ncbi:MAG: serine hydrolase domain-containing protein [Longimicrobiales bacterium]
MRRMPFPILAMIPLLACATEEQPGRDSPAERIARVEAGLLTANVVAGEPTHTIAERLSYYRVPGVSVAVIDSGRIVWARGWGVADSTTGTAVDTSTLFQAASISKPVAAAGALRLVERGLLDLDEDVNRRLKSWQVPENAFTTEEKVTLRRLLSHSAGTTVHGFPGYAADDSVPTLVQVLDGEEPANTAPVRVDTVPGSRWRYSGGGISIAQLLMIDVTDRAFPELMRELVLEPAGMIHSTFEQPLPPARAEEAATAHLSDGTPAAGRYHTYPEMAAAGLWTTPSDLARFAIEIQQAFAGDTSRILSPEMARRMLTIEAGEYGLGFGLDREDDALWFAHGGANHGFRAYFAALADDGRGAVVMTNGDVGSELAQEIMRAIAHEYDWPGFQPNERVAVALDSAQMHALAGAYRAEVPGVDDTIVIEIVNDGGRLLANVPAAGWEGRVLRAASPDTLFLLENSAVLAVERDAAGAVRAVSLNGLGVPIRAERVRE